MTSYSTLQSLEELEALYDTPSARSFDKVQSEITPLYQQWIEASRFLILSTIGSEGTDASPRGDDGSVVEILDPQTILLPDWRGNNRLDSLRNIVADERASLLFMINGESIVVRVNGHAHLSQDERLTKRFSKGDKTPKLVIILTVKELYFQCAKSIIRSQIWQPSTREVPTAGALLKDAIPQTNAEEFDQNYPEYAKSILWR